jgi:hypothetical protein
VHGAELQRERRSRCTLSLRRLLAVFPPCILGA